MIGGWTGPTRGLLLQKGPRFAALGRLPPDELTFLDLPRKRARIGNTDCPNFVIVNFCR
jgi:hypothetical protein